MLHRLIYLLAALCAGLLVFVTFHRPAAAPAPAAHGMGFDWSAVASRDLDIASVFRTARDVGVHEALDSLEALSARDAEVRTRGHMLAHELGRYTIAQHKFDLAVVAQCREIFEAGCYHGVLEGYLQHQKVINGDIVAAICAPLERATTVRLRALECSHGLGHGLLERLDYNLASALAMCDQLRAEDARGECHDGVFMENVVHGLPDDAMPAGDTAAGRSQSMAMAMDMGPRPATQREFFRKTDLAFPCDSVATRYRASCWSYQPLAAIQLTNVDFLKTLRTCDAAAGDAAVNCYRGFGKQSTGWYDDRAPDIIKTCARATAPHSGDCIAGAVEAYVDATWTPNRAVEFCRSVPGAEKAGCYGEVGSRMGLIRADSAALRADCSLAESPFVAPCLERAMKGLRQARM